MTTIDQDRQPDADDLLRALIEEAKRRARRRRRWYRAALFSFALVAGIVLATQHGPPSSPSGSSAAYAPSPSAIQIDPRHPNIVYTSALGDETHEGGVFKSTDAGKTWSLADTGLTNPSSPTDSEDLRVDALALDPRSPGVLYAGTGLGVFKTTDGAKTWTLASSGIEFSGGIVHRMLEGFIYEITIDPVHTSTVSATGSNGIVWKSTDGGSTWHLTR